jgi:hypothetical protein
MQKLKQRTITNTPTDAPQVRSNCGLSLNREETLSVPDLKTCFNNPEVDLPQHTEGLKAKKYVFVLSLDDKPLMPCKPAKARKLLKSQKAKVVKLYPFTIKLNFECENQTQEVSLGIDTGYENVGFSCITNKKELFSGTLILDGKTSKRLTEKRMYRKLRRNKHHWYRKPRFLNRKTKEGWLPPSVQRRYDTHLRLINIIKSILPISKTTIETAKFDIQKIENQHISRVEYQQGDMYGYQNTRSYLMAREHGLCQICHKKFTSGNPSHIHHCMQRNEQGSNRPQNLALIHKKCHENLHKKGLKLSAPKSYKSNAFMSTVNKKFKIDIPDANITFGYITFIKRNQLKLIKTHYNDAFVISGGQNQERIQPIIIKQKHRNNRSIQLNRKGFKPSIRKNRYPIQPKDLIWIDNKLYIASGIHCNGKRVVVENTKKSYPIQEIQKTYHFGSFSYN